MDADAVVIGAGAAGLAAARALARAKLSVVVLEARDRTGGRVLSQPLDGSGGYADLGAEFIHGTAKETMELLHAAKLSAVPVEGDSWVCGEDGVLRREERDFAETTGGIFEQTRTLARDESVDDFLRRFENDPAMRDAVRAARSFVEGFDAADPCVASARAIAEELRSGVDSTSTRPVGSYHGMFAALEAACVREGAMLSRSTTVRRIAWGRGMVVAETTSGARAQTFTARAAIVTVPAGVLRAAGGEETLAFDPALPREKYDALRSIEMGHVVKVAVWYRSPFWRRLAEGRYRDAAFFRPAKGAFGAFWTQIPLHGTVVMAWAGGPKAFALEDCGEAALIERAVTEFGALFGAVDEATRELQGGFHHDWTRDPFSRGAYSYVAAGGGNARDVLAAPVDATLFFGGEATCSDGQGGTVNGALASGERAAGQMLAALSSD